MKINPYAFKDNKSLAEQKMYDDWEAKNNPNFLQQASTGQVDPEVLKIQKQMAEAQLINAQLQNAKMQQEQKDLAGPEMTYNPLQTRYRQVQGPFGKINVKEVGLAERYKLKGPESYIEKALGQQALEEGKLRDETMLAQQQGLAQARANMAMRGGVRGGNMLQLQRQGMKDVLAGRQQVGMQGAQARAGIGLEGDKMGREINKYNLENELRAMGAGNEWDMKRYQTRMAAQAAKKSAEATRAAAQDSSKK